MLKYTTKHFNQLSLGELYRILQLRSEVFVLEQNCVFLDQDDKDQNALHVLGKDENGDIHSYTRLLDRGISYDEYSSIGRVVNSQKTRGTGEGKRLMIYSIEKIKESFPTSKVKISAQSYLLKFYSDLGFVSVGEEYLEDDIPHTAMILEL
jgi:ElaA protein